MESEAIGIPARGEEIGGKYRVEKVIGEGGMGAVFAARNLLTGKRVAIKWLLPEHAGSVNRERLLREAQLAGSIEHPNIVDIYDVGEHHGGLFLVMEYLPGRPLSELMMTRGILTPHELIPLLIPAMRGVHAAHLAGVIHRDLKPENIILSEHEQMLVPKVVDFGVSKVTALSAIPDASLTRAGALVGTPHYMALEQINGSSVIDPRTDVYAFGVVLYRGLTGLYPFDGATISEIILTIGTTEAPSMRVSRPELPEELDKVVMRALSRNFESRFASLEEMVTAIAPFAGEDGAGRPSWQGSVPVSTIGVHSVELPRIIGVPRPDQRNEDTFRTENAARALRRRRILIAAVGAAAMLIGAGLVLRSARSGAFAEQTTNAHEAQEEPSHAGLLRRVEPAPVLPADEATSTKSHLAGPHPAESQASDSSTSAPTRAPKQNDSEVRPQAKRAAPPAGRPRPQALPDTTKGPRAVIPGRRTNGLSVDDF